MWHPIQRSVSNQVITVWMQGSLFLLVATPFLIGIGLFWKAAPLIAHQPLTDLLFSGKWFPLQGEFGFLPFIYSSLYVTILAFIISAPLCLFAAIHLTQFGKPRLLHFMLPVIDILAGIP